MKSSTLFIMLIVSASSMLVMVDAESSTAGLWLFNDRPLSNTAADESANGNTLTLTNMDSSTDWVAGKYNYGLELDGTNDNCLAAYDSSMDLSDTNCTLEGWIYLESGGGAWQMMIQKAGCYYLAAVSKKPRVVLYWGLGGDYTVLASDDAISENEWYHIAGIYDGAEMKLVVDGQIVNSVAETSTLYTNTNPIYVGSWVGSSDFMKGKLDEIRISAAALNLNDLGYWGSLASDTAVCLWSLDESAGASASDSSGNGNTLDLFNSPSWVSGIINNGLDFDSTDDYCSAAHDGASMKTQPQVTLQGWLNLDSYANCDNWPMIFHKHYSWYLGCCLDKPRVYFYWDDSTTTLVDAPDTADISENEWHHIAASYDGSTVKLFVDFELVNSTAVAGKTLDCDAARPLFVGCWDGDNNLLDGTLDELKISNIAEDIIGYHGVSPNFQYSDTFNGKTGIILISSLDSGDFVGQALVDTYTDPVTLTDRIYEDESFYVAYYFSGGDLDDSFTVDISTSDGIELVYENAGTTTNTKILSSGNWDGVWGCEMAWQFKCLSSSSSDQQWVEVLIQESIDTSNFVGGKIFVNVLPARSVNYKQLFDPAVDNIGFWMFETQGLGAIYDYYGLDSMDTALFPDEDTLLDRIACVNSNYYILYGAFNWVRDNYGDSVKMATYETNLLKNAEMIKAVRPDNKVLLQIGSTIPADSDTMTYFSNLVKASEYLDGMVYDWETDDYNQTTSAAQFNTLRTKLGSGEELVICTDAIVPSAYSDLRWSDIEDTVDWFLPMAYFTYQTRYLDKYDEWARDEWLYDAYTTTSDSIIPNLLGMHMGSTQVPVPANALYDAMQISEEYGHQGAMIYRAYGLSEEAMDIIDTAFGTFELNFTIDSMSTDYATYSVGDTINVSVVVRNAGADDFPCTVPVDFYLGTVENETDPGCVGMWQFEGPDTTIAVDSSVGGDNDATLYNIGSSPYQSGKVGNSLYLDGQGNDYLEVPYNTTMDITDSITIEAWVKLDERATGWWQTILYNEDLFHLDVVGDTNPDASEWFLGFTLFWEEDGDTGTDDYDIMNSADAFSFDTWYHVAGTYSGTTMSLYINGTLTDTKTVAGRDIRVRSSKDIYIGSWDTSGGYGLDGALDDVGLYSYAKDGADLGYYWPLGKMGTYEISSLDSGETCTASIAWSVPDVIQKDQTITISAMADPVKYFHYYTPGMPGWAFNYEPQLVSIVETDEDDNDTSMTVYIDNN
jgi:concanavalin A-like lectin/glucanase superfamily protein